MKNFYDVYDSKLSEAELPTLYCDVDQVLCNFLDGAEKVLGKSFIEFDKDRRWPLIHDKKDFWETLEWMPGAKRLWTFVNKYDSHILSAYTKSDSNSIPGKLKWLRKNAKLTQRSRIHLVLRAQKKNFAMNKRQPAILIDDYPKNVQQFKSAGGIGILHSNTQTTISQLRKIGY